MTLTRRKALVAAVLMGSAAAGAQLATPRLRTADLGPALDLNRLFPASFGAWRVDTNLPVILPSPDVQAKLDAIYNQVLSRTYVDRQGRRIMLSVAYGGDQSDGMSIHLPEVCYPAQGFEVRKRQQKEWDVGGRPIPVVQLVTKLAQRTEPVTYWIVVGDEVVPSRTAQKLVKIRYGFRGQIPDGMLVRISSIDNEPDRAFALQAEFTRDLSVAIPADERWRVLGRGAA